ncbi:DUF1616 domain-containing protein [Chloroflexota bacterium]
MIPLPLLTPAHIYYKLILRFLDWSRVNAAKLSRVDSSGQLHTVGDVFTLIIWRKRASSRQARNKLKVGVRSAIERMLDFSLPFLDSVPVIRGIVGFALVFFLPGFAWTLIFFGGRQINMLERLVLSIGLSIATVTLSILAANVLFGVSITGTNSVLVILVITAIPTAWYYLKRIIGRRRGDAR